EMCVVVAPSGRRREKTTGGTTLDVLVAMKSNGEPLASRCLSEHEAIQSPDDSDEIKRMENDPDVSTRTCSLCGYQGKWVSEMIRHKRVHTNDRPFKCRYCSRTSKWKADLIRHVAKTHGIRVVSKYSRSKTLNESRSSFQLSPKSVKDSSLSPRSSCSSPFSPTQSIAYRCLLCNLEQEELSNMIKHLSNVHALPPYSCLSCASSMPSIEFAMAHTLSCPSSTIKPNMHTVYGRSLEVDTSSSTPMSSSSPLLPLPHSPLETSLPSSSILPLLALLLPQLYNPDIKYGITATSVDPKTVSSFHLPSPSSSSFPLPSPSSSSS
ncbi:hypothetical protein PMAYCL1PPCAC_23717, partial [Pristionchus mayeri]